jgi:hypothetical protein
MGAGVNSIPLGSRVEMYLGTLDISGTNNLDNEAADFMASPVLLKRLYFQVTTAVTGASSALTVTWRPTPGSATDAVALGTVTFPVASVDTQHNADMYASEGDTTVVNAGGQTSQYGIGGVTTYTAEADLVCGPGGELRIASDGGASAGVVAVWAEVMSLPFSGANVIDRPVAELTVSV